MSWLDLIPVSTDVFYYDGSIICHDCGVELIDKLRRASVSEDELPTHYPDGGGEADNAQFCNNNRRCVNAVTITPGRKIGCPLGNPLTNEGAMAMRNSILLDLIDPHAFANRVGRLIHRVWGDYVRPEETVKRVFMPISNPLPPTLKKTIKQISHPETRRNVVVEPSAVIDAEHVYFLAHLAGGASADLLRLPVDDEGEFHQVDVVTVPSAVVAGFNPHKLIEEAISSMAWD